MPGIRTLAVIGVGLIGGSLGRGARESGFAAEIVGFDSDRANLKTAVATGVIDRAADSAAAAAGAADLVILATPVGAMREALEAAREGLRAGTIVSDVGSVKALVVEQLETLIPPGVAFVPAHPIAGRETSGARAADPTLFQSRRVVLTPSSKSTPEAIETVTELYRSLGAAEVLIMDARVHDELMAFASHLPQIVATELVRTLDERAIDGRKPLDFGASGLFDTTRLALSDPLLWRDICMANAAAIGRAVEALSLRLARFKSALEAGEAEYLTQEFSSAGEARRRLKR